MKKAIIIFAMGLFSLLIILGILFQYSRSWKNGLFLKPIYKLNTDKKVVALTFDDGPGGRTEALLEVLRRNDVEATFFMLGGKIEDNPEIAKQVFEEGHLIGNHTYNHPRMLLKTPSDMKSQILNTDGFIKNLGQEDIEYFRPPYSNKFIILPLVLKSLDKKLVTCTLDPIGEYESPYNGQRVVDEVIDKVEPGTIIVLHDGPNSNVEDFVNSVEQIIVKLKEQGYEFVRLDY